MSKSVRTNCAHINYATVEFFNKHPEKEYPHENSKSRRVNTDTKFSINFRNALWTLPETS